MRVPVNLDVKRLSDWQQVNVYTAINVHWLCVEDCIGVHLVMYAQQGKRQQSLSVVQQGLA